MLSDIGVWRLSSFSFPGGLYRFNGPFVRANGSDTQRLQAAARTELGESGGYRLKKGGWRAVEPSEIAEVVEQAHFSVLSFSLHPLNEVIE